MCSVRMRVTYCKYFLYDVSLLVFLYIAYCTDFCMVLATHRGFCCLLQLLLNVAEGRTNARGLRYSG